MEDFRRLIVMRKDNCVALFLQLKDGSDIVLEAEPLCLWQHLGHAVIKLRDGNMIVHGWISKVTYALSRAKPLRTFAGNACLPIILNLSISCSRTYTRFEYIVNREKLAAWLRPDDARKGRVLRQSSSGNGTVLPGDRRFRCRFRRSPQRDPAVRSGGE